MRSFEGTRIKDMALKNRFIRSATWEGLADDRTGRILPRLIDLLTELAAGGVGLIVAGYAYVSEDGKANPYQTGIYDDDLIPDLSRLTASVHQAGGRIALQIVHAGIMATGGFDGGEAPAGPSPVENPRSKVMAREMTAAEITRVVDDFGAAAGRIKKAGFDAVQLHVAHGYLLSQFMSPFLNRRGDRYGGSRENRGRAVFEAYEAVRGAVGPNYPVMIKINAEDFVEGGVALEDSVFIAARLAEMGLDAVEVSGGVLWAGRMGPSRTKINEPDQEAYFRAQGEAFKAGVKAPVILVGGLRSLDVNEDLLARGQADYLALCRPFIREPDLINRWAGGDASPAACISCNGCFKGVMDGRGISCAVTEKARTSDG
ncbi:MAG: NADH:flavin oxidoreductase [Proteobacteria bacterium]|nr:NADH:flavin oxidoreductase [Pseudomonadota bacterium]